MIIIVIMIDVVIVLIIKINLFILVYFYVWWYILKINVEIWCDMNSDIVVNINNLIEYVLKYGFKM